MPYDVRFNHGKFRIECSSPVLNDISVHGSWQFIFMLILGPGMFFSKWDAARFLCVCGNDSD